MKQLFLYSVRAVIWSTDMRQFMKKYQRKLLQDTCIIIFALSSVIVIIADYIYIIYYQWQSAKDCTLLILEAEEQKQLLYVSALISIPPHPVPVSTFIVHSKLDYCNSPYYNLSKSQITRLPRIQNFLARTLAETSKSVIPLISYAVFAGPKWLNASNTKLLSFTHKVLTTTQPSYLHDLIAVPSPRSNRSSSVVILTLRPTSSSSCTTDRSFRYASPCLRNQPSSFSGPTSSRFLYFWLCSSLRTASIDYYSDRIFPLNRLLFLIIFSYFVVSAVDWAGYLSAFSVR